MPSPNYGDDEAIARALQEQFTQELNQRSQQQRQPSRSTRRSNQRGPQPSAPHEEAIRAQRVEESDEQYARRLAREEERLYQYYQNRQSSMTREGRSGAGFGGNTGSSGTSLPAGQTTNNLSHGTDVTTLEPVFFPGDAFTVKRTNSNDTPKTTSPDGSATDLDDELYARQVEQELNDEELARRLQESDERRASREAARQAATQVEPRPRCTFGCLCGYLICFTFVAAGVIAFMYFFYIQDNDLPGRWIWNPEDFAEEDPFGGSTPEDITPWENDGRGLDIEVVNSLEPDWHPFFYEAILDWDSGYPDALTLRTSETEPDFNCKEIIGKVRVCNGNYGATSWKGICEVRRGYRGFITAATAKLNDYYFNGNSGSMQYTMCHELGHAWGLPHSDENFGNKDLGNCMDYTYNEEKNKRPDISLYDFLFELYGLVPGADPYDPPTAAPTVAPAPTAEPLPDLSGSSSQQVEPQDEAGKDPGRQRKNGETRLLSMKNEGEDELEAALADARHRIMSGSTDGVRLIHKGMYGEVHEADMINGDTLRIHKLYS